MLDIHVIFWFLERRRRAGPGKQWQRSGLWWCPSSPGSLPAYIIFKGTVRPDRIDMRVVPLDRPWKGHQPLRAVILRTFNVSPHFGARFGGKDRGLSTSKPWSKQVGDWIHFCMKLLRTLNSYQIFKIKNKNKKHIAVEVLFMVYPTVILSCRSNLARRNF